MRHLQHRHHLSPCRVVAAAPPSPLVQWLHRCHPGQITVCFKVKYVWKTSQSFENISITFQQSNACSDSSWASSSFLPLWTQAISPQLTFRLFAINNFFLPGILLWRVFIPFLLLFLHNFFSLLPPPKHKLKKHSIYAAVVNWCALAFYIATSLPTPGRALQAPSHQLLFLSSIPQNPLF